MLNISSSSHQPMYYQLKQIIIDKIQSGELKADDKLSTENEFCQQYNISKAPVRQALRELEEENYIYKIRGKGSFVLSGYIKQRADRLRSFSEEITALGHKPGAQLIEKKIMKADAEIAMNLNINEDDEILNVVRLRFIDSEIYSINYSYFSLKQFPKLNDVDFSVGSITKEIQNKLNAEMVVSTIVIEATAASYETAKLVERRVGSPLLQMKRTT